MKKWWSAAMVALVLVTCGVWVAGAEDMKPAGTQAKSSEAKSSTEKGAAKNDATTLQAKLEAQEHKFWDAFKAKDAKAVMEVISSDGWSADMMGFAPASQISTMMQDYTLEDITMQDPKVLRLDKDAAILLYTANFKATYKGQPIPSGPYYCSTTYVSRGSKWLAMYHQESLAQSAMPTSAGMPEGNK